MEDVVFSSDSYSFGAQNRHSKERELVCQPVKGRPLPNSMISCMPERESLNTQIKNLKSQLLTEDKDKAPDQDLLNMLEELYSKRRVSKSKVTPHIHRKCYSRNVNVLTSKEDLLKEIKNLKQIIETMETEKANMCEQFVKALRLLKEQMLLEQSRDAIVKDNLDENLSVNTYETETKTGKDTPSDSAKQNNSEIQRGKRRTYSEISSRSYERKNSNVPQSDHIATDSCQCILF